MQFPAGLLQFEVGIQSFNPEVQQRISRRQDNLKTADNLRWLVNESQAHVHADLIFGLPGETLESFADGFDRLHELAPHEIQFGILKRLRGTPITRHTLEFAMAYDPQTPYTILQTSTIDFATMQRIQRFARYWEMVANSGRFAAALRLLLCDETDSAGSAFNHFLAFSDWLWCTTAKTHEFALEKLLDLLFEHLTQARGLNGDAARAAGRNAWLSCWLAGAWPCRRAPESPAPSGRAGMSASKRTATRFRKRPRRLEPAEGRCGFARGWRRAEATPALECLAWTRGPLMYRKGLGRGRARFQLVSNLPLSHARGCSGMRRARMLRSSSSRGKQESS
ncbi:DUF4080 domain-containing protein [Polaromonas sp.]|uniref:DUF4080 domain-containing protein n=1 Tax=Polaromonas sp. TaxID=1869339 RepID=UPI003BB5DB51